MSKLTLLDLAKRNDNDATVGIVESMVQQNGLLERLPFRGINGTSYKFARRVGLPTVSFRGYNEGIASSKSVIEQITVETKNIGGRSEVDKLLAEADMRGVNMFRAEEDAGFAAVMGNTYNLKAFYGNSKTNANEYDGIATILSSVGNTVIDAGASTGSVSSLYAVSFQDAVSPNGRMKGVEGLLGNGKNISAIDMGLQYVADSGGTNKYLAYVTEFEFAPGLAVYDNRSIGRIANINASNKPSITDINQLITAMFPFKPSVFFVSKTAFNYVQELKGTSFSSIDPMTGTELFQRVLHFDGIPIIIDENISDAESVIS